jgi:hypothetical protein
MLKVIIMLDCNICGQLFDGVVTSSELDPLDWKVMSLDLEDDAERSGWSFYRSAHHCDHCVTDVAFSLRQAADEASEVKKTI